MPSHKVIFLLNACFRMLTKFRYYYNIHFLSVTIYLCVCMRACMHASKYDTETIIIKNTDTFQNKK